MALDVYFREDIGNILMGHLMARPDWSECLEAVGRSIGIDLSTSVGQGVKIIWIEEESTRRGERENVEQTDQPMPRLVTWALD